MILIQEKVDQYPGRSSSKFQHLEPNYAVDSFAKSVGTTKDKKVFSRQSDRTCLDGLQYSPPLH